MSDSEDDELAALRREREARLGSAGITVTALRNKFHQEARGSVAAAAAVQSGWTAVRDDDGDGPVVVDAAEDGAADEAGAGAERDGGADEAEDGIPAELRAHLPASFGGGVLARRQAQQEAHRERQLQQARGATGAPPRPAGAAAPSSDGGIRLEAGGGPAAPAPAEDGREDSTGAVVGFEPAAGSGGEEEDPWRLPVTSEVALTGHTRAVVAVDLDHSGSRLLTGSTDYTVKIYDFNGMKADLRPFRSVEPCEGNPIVALSWSPTGEAFLCATGSPQAKVYGREGKEAGELPRGDMYIRDMKNTKGHVSGCTGGQWHPTDKGTGMTCSDDGTIRIWDLWELVQKTVVKPTLARPGRVSMTAASYSTDGRLIVGGLNEGTLQLWDVRGKFGRSAAVGVVPQPKAQVVPKQTWSYVSATGQLLWGAHAPGNEITCLRFSLDGFTLLSRGGDETLKLWDLRSFKAPVAAAEGLANNFSTTGCCFSPDESVVVTGLSARSAEGAGALAFYDRRDLSLVRRLGVEGSAVAVTWHPGINQIVVGCGDRKKGAAHVLYDASASSRGALLAVGRQPRRENPLDFAAAAELQIYNPNALPMYRQAWPGQQKRKKDREPAGVRTSKSFRPEQGQAGGKGAGGKLGTTGGSLLTQYVLKHQGQLKAPEDEDVRASILRHADKEDEFSRFTRAYKETQPQRIYAEEEREEEEGEDEGPAPAK